jgi:hypothetical protein
MMVEELLNFDYPIIRRRLNTRSKITDLFKALGQRNDPSICQMIEENADTILTSPDICFTSDVMTVRENLLKDKKFTDDQIKNLLNKERNRNKQNLQKLAELATAIRNNPDSLFGEPQIFCKGNEKGLIEADDMPSLKENIADTVDSLFNTFATVFQKDSFNFTKDIVQVTVEPNLQQKVIKKFTDTTVIDNNNEIQIIENSLNSKFMQKVANGQFTLCDENGSSDKESLLKYYDYKVNGNDVITNDVIDTQTLINTTNYNAFEEDKNVFIINYNYIRKVTPDILKISNNINDYLTINYDKFSINFAIPNKYSSITDTSNQGSFNVLSSSMNVTIFTISGSN